MSCPQSRDSGCRCNSECSTLGLIHPDALIFNPWHSCPHTRALNPASWIFSIYFSFLSAHASVGRKGRRSICTWGSRRRFVSGGGVEEKSEASATMTIAKKQEKRDERSSRFRRMDRPTGCGEVRWGNTEKRAGVQNTTTQTRKCLKVTLEALDLRESPTKEARRGTRSQVRLRNPDEKNSLEEKKRK